MNKSLALKDACFLLLLSIFVMAALPSVAQNFWAGTWETHWATGSARMLLSQDGSRVSGSYPLLSGQIEAAAEGKLLRGRWSEDQREGSFEFILAEDGQSFIGRRDGVDRLGGGPESRGEFTEADLNARMPYGWKAVPWTQNHAGRKTKPKPRADIYKVHPL
jgi:hypothetical protein